MIYFIAAWLTFIVFDIMFYQWSDYELRTSSYGYKLVGGGFVAYYQSRKLQHTREVAMKEFRARCEAAWKERQEENAKERNNGK